MRDGRWCAWLVPTALRERVYGPVLADAHRERVLRLRHAGPIGRAFIHLRFHAHAFWLAVQCRALTASAPASSGSFLAMQDITFALRTLRKSPGFTAAAVIAIALGIGANTAIFTVIRQVLLRPLPYPGAGRLVDVDELKHGRPSAVSPPNFMDWRARNHTLSGIALYNESTMTLVAGAEPQRVDACAIDAELLPVLQVAPVLGRAFTAADLRPGARPVALLGFDLWQQTFGSDRAVVGTTIALEGERYEVVGVLPRGFDFPGGDHLWVPLSLTTKDLSDQQRGAHYVAAVGRLRDGVSLDAARLDLDGIEQSLARQFPSKIAGYSAGVQPLLQAYVGDVQRPLWVLFGAVGFVLLIACVNVSNLLLARGTTRSVEMAVRSALGAGRGRLVRQLLAESLVLSLAGGACGVLLGVWGVRTLLTFAPSSLPRHAGVQVDVAVLLFSALLSILAGILFGTAPALIASRADLTVFLRDARRDGGSAGHRRRLRDGLVAAQVALVLVLLAGAALAGRSFARLTSVDPGFRTGGILAFQVELPSATYATPASIAGFFREYLGSVRALTGVVSAGAVSFAPLTPAGFGGSFTIDGRPDGANEGSAQIRSVTPGYLEALAIPLRAGRVFDEHDNESGARVAIISETAARQYWPNEDPIGKRLRLHVNEPTRAVREIVGVVADIHIHQLDVAPQPVVYVPHAQYGPEVMTVVARAAGDPMTLVPAVVTALRGVGPGVAMGTPRTLDAVRDASIAQPRFRTMLLLVFAGASLLLAAVGLYGVVSFSVNQRRAEFGLRMALGADRKSVMQLVLVDGLTPVAIGLGVGLAGALALARVMRSLLFEVAPFDPLAFAAVMATLAAVATMACYLPARRATHLSPLTALRG